MSKVIEPGDVIDIEFTCGCGLYRTQPMWIKETGWNRENGRYINAEATVDIPCPDCQNVTSRIVMWLKSK